jgi:hypothetical protein
MSRERPCSTRFDEQRLARESPRSLLSTHLVENVGNLRLVATQTSLQDIVRLGDQLHVSVLDTVVNHLDVVTGSTLTDPITTGLTERLGSGLLEDFLDRGPSGGRTTGHQGRTVSGTLFTTGNTGSNKQETLGLEFLGPSDRIRVVRVSTVDDDVALFEERFELLDERVDGGSGLDEEDDLSGSLELFAELLDGVGADDVGVA